MVAGTEVAGLDPLRSALLREPTFFSFQEVVLKYGAGLISFNVSGLGGFFLE